eukprot:361148-Rhodomonas_salina.1
MFWVAPDGTRDAFPGLKIDLEEDQLKQSPDEVREFASSSGGCKLEYWNFNAFVVFWPREWTAHFLLKHDFNWVARTTKARARALESGSWLLLEEALKFKSAHPTKRLGGSDLLIDACVSLKEFDALTELLQLISSAGEGVSSPGVAEAMASAVSQFGWKKLGAEVLEVVRSSSPEFSGFCAHLAVLLGPQGER